MTEKPPKQINIYGEEEPIREPVKLGFEISPDQKAVRIWPEEYPDRWIQFSLRYIDKKPELFVVDKGKPLEGGESEQVWRRARAILLGAHESGKFVPHGDQTELDLI